MRAQAASLSAARALALLSFAAASILVFYTPAARTAATLQQRKGIARAPNANDSRRRTPPRDRSRFSHSTAAHLKRDCASCHRVASLEKPDISDFPDHPSCVECHRREFFRGARPPICADCHVTVSPRAATRLAFPNPSAPAEFADLFPHANHIKTTSLIQFKKVIGEKSNIQATCLYCHRPSPALAAPNPQTTQQAPKQSGAGSSVAFVPPAGTYMTTPTSHANCFQCHWQKGVADHEQEPYATQCASCHRNINAGAQSVASRPAAANVATNVAANTAAPRNAASALSVVPAHGDARSSFLTARRELMPPRAAQKFVHEIDAHRKRLNEEGKEVAITCLQCHAAARRVTTLEDLRLRENKAGLQTCSSSACHTAVSGAAQMHLSVYRELRERAKDAKFDCALCHAPPASLAADVPCTHFASVFASATKEKKGTKGIEQLTPPRCAEALKKTGQ
jgi:hypothetical protein